MRPPLHPLRATNPPPASPLRLFQIATAILLAAASSSHAQLPQARLLWLFPPGAPAGSTNEIALGGSALDEPSGLVFSDPRITAAPRSGDPLTFTVVVPPDIPPGFVDARFSGRFGLSNPRAFAISHRLETAQPPTNVSVAAAATLPPETVINGRLPATSAQWYRFDARRGQRLLAFVQARELDSRLVPDLAVFDAAGRELAAVRRAPLLDFTAPTDDAFLLRLHDQMFRGGDDFVYRLLLTAGPHIDFALPLALNPATPNRVTLLGRNLPNGCPSGRFAADGSPLDRFEFVVATPPSVNPSAPPLDAFRRPAALPLAPETMSWGLPGSPGTGARLRFALTATPVNAVLAPGLVAVEPPVEFSAFYPAHGEISGVTFSARKGDVWWIELLGDRLGYVCDPWAVVQRVTRAAKGTEKITDVLELNDTEANHGGREFDTATRDAAGRFQAPDDGNFRVIVRDLFNRLPSHPRLPYRLSMRPESPDFRLVALPQPQPRMNDNDRQIHLWSTVLRRGETVPIRIVAFRQDGFAGDIDLDVSNLPPGIQAAHVRIAAGQSAASILLTASKDAPVATAPITVTGRAQLGDTRIVRTAVFATAIWPVADWDQERGNSRLAASLPVSVCAAEAAPLSMTRADTEPATVDADGKVALTFTLDRQPDFPAAFTLKWAGHPEVEKLKEIAVPEKATNTVVELNLSDTKVPPGIHTLWLQGLLTGKYRNNPEALAEAEAALKTAEERLQNASPDTKPGAEERRNTAAAAKKAAEERAKPRDVTLAVYSRPFTVNVKAPTASDPK